MLTKNVYIVYPAGYHGSYVKWAIEVSDIDRQVTTVLDPLNRSTSTSHGGKGTSHAHVRIPTHQGFSQHTTWVIKNRPSDPMVYIINPTGDSMIELCRSLVQILLQDPTGIIITINDGNDPITQSYGRINCVTKWPTFMLASDAIADNKNFEIHENFDPFNCANDLIFRNRMVTDINQLTANAYNSSTTSGPLNLDVLQKCINQNINWYDIRNRYQPHEVNEETYVSKIDYTGRLFELDIKDIPSNKFLPKLKDILSISRISDNIDFAVLKNYHDDYISAQPNLQWFNSFTRWEQTGELDSYLLSHGIIQAELIREIMHRCHFRVAFTKADNKKWQEFYNNVRDISWPDAATESDFYRLPEYVKTEILIPRQYKLLNQQVPNDTISKLDWQKMSLQDINHVYQTQIKLLETTV
jgi:hypothetical protein